MLKLKCRESDSICTTESRFRPFIKVPCSHRHRVLCLSRPQFPIGFLSPLTVIRRFRRDTIWLSEIEASERRGGNKDGCNGIAQPNSDERSAIVLISLSIEREREREQSHKSTFHSSQALNARTYVTQLTHGVHIITDTLKKISARAHTRLARPLGQRTSAKNRPGYVINRF